jgi:hypothetical protein
MLDGLFLILISFTATTLVISGVVGILLLVLTQNEDAFEMVKVMCTYQALLIVVSALGILFL